MGQGRSYDGNRANFSMTTIKVQLPDELAQDAERAGLLSAEALEQKLRQQLRSQRAHELFDAMDRMSESDTMPAMSPEEIAAEIAIMRAERRANRT